MPELDVVFLHGLDGDRRKTWSSGSANSYWPEWLAADNPKAAVWCVGYDAYASAWRGGAMGILDRAVNILALLTSRGIGQRPLCFIGHSMGGLLAKQALIQAAHAAREYGAVADQAKGVVFLATPHTGAAIARIAQAYTIFRPTELVGNLIRDDSALRHLSASYRTWAAENQVEHVVFFETRGLRLLRRFCVNLLVVPRSSADPGLLGATPIGVDADHTQICKPVDRESLVYARVNRFVAGLIGQPSLAPSGAAAVSRPAQNDAERRLWRRGTVLEGSGWSATLRNLYPRYRLLEYVGAEFPIWTKLAGLGEQLNLDAVLANEPLPGQDPRQPAYPSHFDPAGEPGYRADLATIDDVAKFDGATYALDRIEIDGSKIKIHARHGTYFHSLNTSELLERELIDQLAPDPNPKSAWTNFPDANGFTTWPAANMLCSMDVAARQRCLLRQPS